MFDDVGEFTVPDSLPIGVFYTLQQQRQRYEQAVERLRSEGIHCYIETHLQPEVVHVGSPLMDGTFGCGEVRVVGYAKESA
jgi:hypothetical protein